MPDNSTSQTLEADAPSFAFDPNDPWTTTFQLGLERAALAGKKVYEVGIGTGINAAFLLSHCRAALVSGGDLDPRLADLAESNVKQLVSAELASRFHPVKGSVSLIDTAEAQTQIADTDVIIACLPQVGDPGDQRVAAFRDAQSVPLPEDAEVRADDHIAHYYPWAAFDLYPFNTVGLGLNEALLDRVRHQAPEAQVIMNFGARIGTDILFEFFEANGFTPTKLASQIVLQDAGTDISFFVMLEKALQGTEMENDFTCHFYADNKATERLSACEAQALLEEDESAPLYHEVCTILGQPVPA